MQPQYMAKKGARKAFNMGHHIGKFMEVLHSNKQNSGCLPKFPRPVCLDPNIYTHRDRYAPISAFSHPGICGGFSHPSRYVSFGTPSPDGLA